MGGAASNPVQRLPADEGQAPRRSARWGGNLRKAFGLPDRDESASLQFVDMSGKPRRLRVRRGFDGRHRVDSGTWGDLLATLARDHGVSFEAMARACTSVEAARAVLLSGIFQPAAADAMPDRPSAPLAMRRLQRGALEARRPEAAAVVGPPPPQPQEPAKKVERFARLSVALPHELSAPSTAPSTARFDPEADARRIVAKSRTSVPLAPKAILVSRSPMTFSRLPGEIGPGPGSEGGSPMSWGWGPGSEAGEAGGSLRAGDAGGSLRAGSVYGGRGSQVGSPASILAAAGGVGGGGGVPTPPQGERGGGPSVRTLRLAGRLSSGSSQAGSPNSGAAWAAAGAGGGGGFGALASFVIDDELPRSSSGVTSPQGPAPTAPGSSGSLGGSLRVAAPPSNGLAGLAAAALGSPDAAEGEGGYRNRAASLRLPAVAGGALAAVRSLSHENIPLLAVQAGEGSPRLVDASASASQRSITSLPLLSRPSAAQAPPSPEGQRSRSEADLGGRRPGSRFGGLGLANLVPESQADGGAAPPASAPSAGGGFLLPKLPPQPRLSY
eukprot:tig00000955_g5780.t1